MPHGTAFSGLFPKLSFLDFDKTGEKLPLEIGEGLSSYAIGFGKDEKRLFKTAKK